ASEFLVAASASLGFVVGLREEFIHNLPVVAGLAIGGIIVAPFAAWLVSRVNPALLGTAVGGLIVLLNSQRLVTFFGVTWPWSSALYALFVMVWAALMLHACSSEERRVGAGW